MVINRSKLNILTPEYIMSRLLSAAISDIFSHQTSPLKILDVGCGSKPYAHLFPGSHYVGLEVLESGHDHSFSKVDVVYDGVNFPFNDSVFDLIICSEVLEHVFEGGALMRECSRVLKPKGTAVLTTPFIWQLHEEPYDFVRYTCFGLKKMLLDAGFAVKQEMRLGGGAIVLIVIAQLTLWQFSTRCFGKLGRALVSPLIALLNIVSLLLRSNAGKSKIYLSNIVLVSPLDTTK